MSAAPAFRCAQCGFASETPHEPGHVKAHADCHGRWERDRLEARLEAIEKHLAAILSLLKTRHRRGDPL